jgi:serine protease Do
MPDDMMKEFRKRFGGAPEEFHGKRPNRPHGMPFKGVGSGFVIDPDGYVVTNNHVIGQADEIEVILADGTRHAAEVVGRDRSTDLALLKIEAPEPLAYVRFAEAGEARIGDWVVAVGNPFGLGTTATTGIISAQGRGINAGPYDNFLQIDAPINKGNSGGPSFNLKGEVVGVNTAIISPTGGSVGIGFAIPASMAEEIVGELKTQGHVDRGWLGVQIQDVSEDIAESLDLDDQNGAIVAKVLPGSPANAAGLAPGDVIRSVNGEVIADRRDLSRAIAGIDAGEKAALTVWRHGKEVAITVEIGRLQEQTARAPKPEEKRAAELGMILADMDAEARSAFDIPADVSGVVVADVARNGPAAAKGIRPGDVIVSVGEAATSTPADVAAQIAEAREKGRGAVLMLMNRGGEIHYLAVPLA